MSLPFNFSTTFIPGTACIGDSRSTINTNFSTLLSAISTLWLGAPLLSSNGLTLLDTPLVIKVNSASPALRIKQDGYGNAITVNNSNNALGTLFAVSSAGQVVIGSLSAFNGEASLQVVSDSIGGFGLPPNSNIVLRLNSNSPNAANLILEKARGTQTQMSAVSANDFLGSLVFYGYNGTRMISAASIAVKVEGIPNLSAVPGSLVFNTRLSSNTVTDVTERMRITHDGKVGIGTLTPTTILDVSGTINTLALSTMNISAASIIVPTINSTAINSTTINATNNITTSKNIVATGLASVSGINIIPATAGDNIFQLTTINNLVSALAITVNNTKLYIPLLSAI